MRRVSAAEAKELLDRGYVYVDVRPDPEFAAGHPEGAIHLEINDGFVNAMLDRFPLDAKIVIGCQSGKRSERAVRLLEAAGFTDVVDQRAGFGGAKDAFGRTTEKGWAAH